MVALARSDLWSLEEYSETRAQFRQTVLAHKRDRRVQLGEHLALIFEDAMTVKYQVQEMLRVERIFDRGAIQEELDAYTPLIPDGSNLKATLMIEYDDVEERRGALAQLKGVEDKVWVQIGSSPKSWAIADEDLERENEEKTSAVHFLRFEFDESACQAAKADAPIAMGVDHPAYSHVQSPVAASIAKALAADFA